MKNWIEIYGIKDEENKAKLNKRIDKVREVINQFYYVQDRIDLLSLNWFQTDIKPMGSGGVGQIKEVDGCYRMQISYGWGKWNYANIVYL